MTRPPSRRWSRSSNRRPDRSPRGRYTAFRVTVRDPDDHLTRDNAIGRSTGYEYPHEGIDVLAARAPGLHGALLGRICGGRARHAGDRARDKTRRLLSRAVWDTSAAMGAVRRFAVSGLQEAARRGGRRGLVTGALDETGQEKTGTATAGVHRQYQGCAGKVANGISTVHRACVLEHAGHALTGARQWIPAAQIADPARSAAAGLPPGLEFRTRGSWPPPPRTPPAHPPPPQDRRAGVSLPLRARWPQVRLYTAIARVRRAGLCFAARKRGRQDPSGWPPTRRSFAGPARGYLSGIPPLRREPYAGLRRVSHDRCPERSRRPGRRVLARRLRARADRRGARGHRPGRSQDDHQRTELRREDRHGRLREQQHGDVRQPGHRAA